MQDDQRLSGTNLHIVNQHAVGVGKTFLDRILIRSLNIPQRIESHEDQEYNAHAEQ
jgi:hypothetical protein